MVAKPPWGDRLGHRLLGHPMTPEHRAWLVDRARRGRVSLGAVAAGSGVLLVVLAVSRWSLRRRGVETPAPSLLPAVGPLLGVLLGRFLVRRQSPEVRVARMLRSEQLLRPLDALAMGAFGLAVLTFLVGAVPHLLYPEPRGRCLDAPPSIVAALESSVAPDVEVRQVQVRHTAVWSMVAADVSAPPAVVSGVRVPRGGAGVWIHEGPIHLLPANGVAAAVTPDRPEPAIGDPTGGYDAARRDAAACIREV